MLATVMGYLSFHFRISYFRSAIREPNLLLSDMDRKIFPLVPQKMMSCPPYLLMLCSCLDMLPSASYSPYLLGDCVLLRQ